METKEFLKENESMTLLDCIDYLASEKMEAATKADFEELKNNYYFLDKVQEAVEAGFVRPDTEEERLRQGFFLLSKDEITKEIFEENLVSKAVTEILLEKYELTESQIDEIDNWVSNQDLGATIEDMVMYCDECIINK